VENFRLTVKQLLLNSEQDILKNNLEKIVKFRETAFLEIDKEVQITKLFEKTKKEIVNKIEYENIKKQLSVKNVILKKHF
jgi:hypothetical protein